MMMNAVVFAWWWVFVCVFLGIFCRKLRAFIRWMRENGIEYSDALAFHEGDKTVAADIGVKALYDLKEGDLIATIPKEACLTVKTSQAAAMLDEAELGGDLGLAVAVMYERSKQQFSKWYGYLQLLPFRQSLPIVWSLIEIDSLLAGTELHKAIKEDRRLIQQDWRECYGILKDLYGEKFLENWFTLEHFLAAKTLVASRAFQVDDIHGFGMVPLADLFNHKTAAEDVHFTSVFDDSNSEEADLSSSPIRNKHDIGQFYLDLNSNNNGCHHEGSEEAVSSSQNGVENSTGSPSDWEGNTDILEMILVKDVAEGHEIFNTYGMLSNSALLHRYGFTEPNNPFDIVNVELATVSDICCQSFTQRHFRRRVNIWRKTGCEPCSSEGSEYFEITADGKPQAELLMLLYIIHLPDPACSSLLFEDDLVGKATRDVVAENENKLNAILGELDCWLLTIPVCRCLMSLLLERNSLYPQEEEGSMTKSVQMQSGKNFSLKDSVDHERTKLENINCEQDPKLFHALSLRLSERTILHKCCKNQKGEKKTKKIEKK
ncbi:unnamed protein product [Sphagnum tenellum]